MAITIHKPKTGTPLVTLEEVEEWREELRKLKDQQAMIGAKILDLEKHLTAADFFVRREHITHKLTASDLHVGATPETKPSMPPTMQEAVLWVLQKNPNGMEPKQISNVIRINPDMPPKIKNAHPNYIYTVLMRLVQQGTISKYGAAYKLTAKTADTG